MRRILAVLIVILFGLTGCNRSESPEVMATYQAEFAIAKARAATEQAKLPKCYIQFQAAIQAGPDAGLSVAGDLKFEVARTGVLSGTLLRESGPALAVSGQVTGRAANLILDLGDGQFLFAVGTLQNDLEACTGVIGGTLTSSRPGNRGDWGTRFFKR